MKAEYSIDIVLDRRYEVKARKSKKPSGKFRVKLWVYCSTTQTAKRYPTKFSYSVNDFNSIWKTERTRSEFKPVKKQMEELKSDANKIAETIKPFNFKDFEKRLFRNAGDGENVFYHYEQTIKELTENEQLGNASTFDLSMKSIKAFLEHKKGKAPESLPFNEITPAWLNQYEDYMVKKKGKSLTTVSIYARSLRTLFNSAIKANDIPIEIYPFGKDKYKVPGVKRVKKALSSIDLKKLFEAEPRTPEQQKAKDFFFFSYAANGANVKDIALLKREDMQGDTIKFIRAKTILTSKENLSEIVVYLTPFAKEIIEKYGNADRQKDAYIFPILSGGDNAKQRRSKIQNFTKYINQHIKKLAIAEGITGDISTYFARHSFASNAIRQGGSMEFAMEALGHSNIKTTKGYFAGFESEAKREFMEKLMNF